MKATMSLLSHMEEFSPLKAIGAVMRRFLVRR